MARRKNSRAPDREVQPRGKPAAAPAQNRVSPARLAVVVASLLVIAGAALGWWFNSVKPGPDSHPARVSSTDEVSDPNYHRDIHPIVQEHCASCHRPGQSGPFNLLNYADVSKRGGVIAEVVEKRYMPPWLPDEGHGIFADARQLGDRQIRMFRKWVEQGMVEGVPLPQKETRKWSASRWQLGEPDLVVKLPSPYQLPPDGKDVYKNFVTRIPVDRRRFVKGVEFRPGNPGVVHHAFINVDPTRQSRRLAAKQNPPAFDGMDAPPSVVMPAGQMLGWQPGKRPEFSGPGLSWALEPETDLVLQVHLQPSGKEESVDPELGFYFTDEAPTNTCFRLYLTQWQIDIPAGATNHVVENQYVLPVDLEFIRVSAHAHYLGRELEGYAVLPDGSRRNLLRIPRWDFNWQGDYRYETPVQLPKGTRLHMRFTYDNSSQNVRNPFHPPRRVRYGLQTTDEMAELPFQVLARTPADLALLRNDFLRKATLDAVAYNGSVLRENPNDSRAHARLGQALLTLGRFAEAAQHLQSAIRLNPGDDRPHFDLGLLLLQQRRLGEARSEFEAAVRINPDDAQAAGSLGFVLSLLGDQDSARRYLETALRLDPADQVARRNLQRLNEAQTRGR